MVTELLPKQMAEPLKVRMNQLTEAIQSVYPEAISMAFASQIGGAEESAPDERRFNSLWIFTDRYIGEIRSPLSSGQKLNFDVAILADNVDYIRLTSQDYNFQKATEKSQLSLDFTTAPTPVSLRPSRHRRWSQGIGTRVPTARAVDNRGSSQVAYAWTA